MDKMKVIQVVPSIGREAAGPSYSVPGMCRGLHENGVDVTLHLRKLGEISHTDYKVVTYPWYPYLQGVAYCPEMYKGLKKACLDADVIHSNALWMMPCVYPLWACKGTKCKLVVAPRGSLATWSLKKGWLKKKVFGWLLQNAVLRHADMFHATCEKEYEEIRAQGYKQPVAIVPIGMDLPELEKKPQNTEEYAPEHNVLGNTQKGCCAQDDAASPQFKVKSSQFAVGDNVLGTQNSAYAPVARPSEILRTTTHLKRIVFFGRVHKVKAVDNLVKAWGALYADLPDWELVIAGPDCGAKAELDAIIAEEDIPRVRFTGEINGQAKYDFLTDADIYVLPSHTENFGITVAEALACGTPTVASQGTPWEGLETEKCGKWVPIGVEPLVIALRELTSLTDEERVAMGQRGIEWIRRDFSWEGIGAKMKAAYAWLLGQGEKPNFVRVD